MIKNQQLQQIADQQKGKLSPNMKDACDRIVMAGMDFFYKNDQTNEMSVRFIQEAENKTAAVGEGVAMIMLMLSAKSKGKMPWEAGIMAGYILVCDVLDFFEQKGVLQVSNQIIDEANQAYAAKIMDVLHINGDMINKMAQQANDPKVRQAYAQKYGKEPQL